MDRKEAIEIIQKNWPYGYGSQLSKAIQTLIPELKESEDDKMRKMAIKAVNSPEAQSCIKSWGVDPKDVIAWIEKQGEQKSTWSEEDERNLSIAIQYVFEHGYLSTVDWLRSLKERYTWKPSDEQIEAVRIAAEIGTANNSWAMGVLKSMYQDLKKVKE